MFPSVGVRAAFVSGANGWSITAFKYVSCISACVPDQHGVSRGSGQTGGPLPTDGRFWRLSGLQPRGVDGAESLPGGVHVQRCSPVVQTGGPAGGAWAHEWMVDSGEGGLRYGKFLKWLKELHINTVSTVCCRSFCPRRSFLRMWKDLVGW